MVAVVRSWFPVLLANVNHEWALGPILLSDADHARRSLVEAGELEEHVFVKRKTGARLQHVLFSRVGQHLADAVFDLFEL